MMKTFHIAVREFLATAATKGFIIGAIVIPALIGALIPVIILLTLNAKPPKIEGELAVIDHTSALSEAVSRRLSPEELAERRKARMERVTKAVGSQFGSMGGEVKPNAMAEAMALGQVPKIAVNVLKTDADVETEKAPIRTGAKGDPKARLGLIVIDPAAVKPDDKGEYGAYQLYVRPGLDERVIDDFRWAVSEAVRDERFKSAGLDRVKVESISRVNAPSTVEVTATGERKSTEALTMMLPFAFMLLMMMSVMIGGQYLLTTTIEEKSSRVVEVLLSAVSPMELMAGKIIGQMFVGATLLFVYSGVGIGALIAFNLADILGPWKVVSLVIFSGIAYFMIASMLAAVGSAVNELREAQSLQTPVMLAVILPYVLWLPISRDPNSILATVLSFVPPMSPFVMVMRIASTEPPPLWQVLLAMAVGIVSAYLCVWAAAKIFRIGLLMYGKPPNFRTLIKWVRMA